MFCISIVPYSLNASIPPVPKFRAKVVSNPTCEAAPPLIWENGVVQHQNNIYIKLFYRYFYVLLRNRRYIWYSQLHNRKGHYDAWDHTTTAPAQRVLFLSPAWYVLNCIQRTNTETNLPFQPVLERIQWHTHSERQPNKYPTSPSFPLMASERLIQYPSISRHAILRELSQKRTDTYPSFCFLNRIITYRHPGRQGRTRRAPYARLVYFQSESSSPRRWATFAIY